LRATSSVRAAWSRCGCARFARVSACAVPVCVSEALQVGPMRACACVCLCMCVYVCVCMYGYV
jgi:hypothetical protein